MAQLLGVSRYTTWDTGNPVRQLAADVARQVFGGGAEGQDGLG